MSSKKIRLTVRAGSRVRRESHASLDDALAAMEDAVAEARAAGGLPAVKMLREFTPGQRVAARVEISRGGWLGGRTAGIDLMGDGQAVAFSGGVRRQPLEPREGESPYDAIRRALAD